MLAIGLLILGILPRLVPHPHNFTPVIAVALFSGVYLNNKKFAVLVPLALMIISDIVIGFHDTLIFTWGSIALISLIGLGIRKNKNVVTMAVWGVLSSILFFIITNFGAWLSPLYPNTWQGLVECYTLAIPFFRNTFLSTMIYGFVLFGLYELIAGRVKNTRFSAILLSK